MLNCSLGGVDDKNLGDMVYKYVLFLHIHIKSTMRNGAGKLLLLLTMLNKSAMMREQGNRSKT